MRPAERRAVEAINNYCTDEAGLVQFPIDPYAVAQKMGIKVEHRVGLPDKVDGLLIKENPGTPLLAIINHESHINRQRFTLAHEIGHYTYLSENEPEKLNGLGLVEYKNELSSLGTDKREIDANAFAASLLMPESVVRRWSYEGRTREMMASSFGVSLQALGYRLNALGLSYVA